MASCLTYRFLHRPWKARKVMYWLMLPELAGTVTCLAIFALQSEQSKVFPTLLWRIGHENGQNSNPAMIAYAYANHVPVPNVPLPWSTALNDVKLIVSVLSLFVLITKVVMVIMHIFYPVISSVANLVMMALYAATVGGQAGPDYADPNHPSPVPWYLRRGCAIARPYGAVNSCRMAQGAFAAAVFLFAVYVANFALCLWSMWPDRNIKNPDGEDHDQDEYYRLSAAVSGKQTQLRETQRPLSPTP